LHTQCVACVISTKYFCPGRTVRSEWMHTVRAVTDSSLAVDLAPSFNTTCRVAYLLWSLIHRFFSQCWPPIFTECPGFVANCDHTSEWVNC
jgi:hypothetical protein